MRCSVRRPPATIASAIACRRRFFALRMRSYDSLLQFTSARIFGMKVYVGGSGITEFNEVVVCSFISRLLFTYAL